MMGKTTEFLTFKATDGNEAVFPVATVTGSKPGPTVTVTAGVHGCEYAGIAAAVRLFKALDPETVSGTVRIVTITSLLSFEERRMFVCPVDGKNPNRFFPGDPGGSFTEQYVHFLMENIIAKGDYYIDLHGGDMVEGLEDFSIYHLDDSEVSKKSYEMAYYYGLPNLVSTKAGGAWPDDGTTYANAAKRGIPAMITEAGSVGQLHEKDTLTHLNGLTNVLKYLGVLEGKPEEPKKPQGYSGMTWLYTSSPKGIFYKTIEPGMMVTKGQEAGVLEDYFGNELERPVAPVSGKVVFVTTSPAMPEKGLIMGIATG